MVSFNPVPACRPRRVNSDIPARRKIEALSLFFLETKTDFNVLPVDARSVGPTEIGLEQLRNASLPVLEQRLGGLHPVIGSSASEAIENGNERLAESMAVGHSGGSYHSDSAIEHEGSVMRVPRVRFTIRSLMIAVAVVGTVLGVVLERRSRFLRLAEYHRSQIVGAHLVQALMRNRGCVTYWMDANGRTVSSAQPAKDQWHNELSSKYLLAARCPWLPVEGDPPEPE